MWGWDGGGRVGGGGLGNEKVYVPKSSRREVPTQSHPIVKKLGESLTNVIKR